MTHVMVCIASSNKLATPILRTIQGRRCTIYYYYHPLYRLRGLSGLTETHGNSRAQKCLLTQVPHRVAFSSSGGKVNGSNDTQVEKEMATHSSVLTWRVPGTGEPGGLPSMGCTGSDTTEET